MPRVTPRGSSFRARPGSPQPVAASERQVLPLHPAARTGLHATFVPDAAWAVSKYPQAHPGPQFKPRTKSDRSLDRSSTFYARVLVVLTIVLVILTLVLVFLNGILQRHGKKRRPPLRDRDGRRQIAQQEIDEGLFVQGQAGLGHRRR